MPWRHRRGTIDGANLRLQCARHQQAFPTGRETSRPSKRCCARWGETIPAIIPQLLALQRSVADAARESTLALAGRRTGRWVFQREYLLDDGLDLREAIERIGTPALRALVEVDQQGSQLHLLDSPLCAADGHSGCGFFSGFLEGLLGPAIAPGRLSVFSVSCRSCGSDKCVLSISD
jgi:predicted hydrocarbon binding protein